ncbi:serpin E3 isoform X2 [Pleurodeles waltl]|uniref:serpin E3 isoform X2 n=1 Tax=Pleurodeles waltl TaxID=8319 RepID=UPI003709774F
MWSLPCPGIWTEWYRHRQPRPRSPTLPLKAIPWLRPQSSTHRRAGARRAPGKRGPQRGGTSGSTRASLPAFVHLMQPHCLITLILTSGALGKGCCGRHDALEERSTEFAVSFYQKLADTDNRTNLIVSPASVSVSLGVLQFGAQGNTFRQLERALGYNVHDERVQDFLRTVYEELANSSEGIVIRLACALFLQAGIHLSPHFVAQAALWANSSLQTTNFSEPSRTLAQINEWVIHRIGGGMPDFLTLDASASPLTQVALVSTMYFKSTWQKKFSFTDTQTLPFIITEGSILKVPMMHQTADVNYGQFQTPSKHRFTVTELPYLGNKVSMFVVLPSDRITPLCQIESYLTARTIAQWTNGMRKMKMDIFIPRFRIQSNFSLKVVLPTLGITDLFDPRKADFKGISDQDNMYISTAIHKAEIEVTEDGTKASGVTAMVLLKRSRTPVFKADRPFLFFLRQAITGLLRQMD